MITPLLLTFAAVVQIAAAEPELPGLYLRAVTDEQVDGAIKMVDKDGKTVFVSPLPIITPADVESANVADGDKISIKFKFSLSAQKKLGEATRSMIGKKLAIIVDGKLMSTPTVASEFSAEVNITGFTREWANSVVEQVKKAR